MCIIITHEACVVALHLFGSQITPFSYFFFKEFNGILAYDAKGDLRIAGLLAVLIHKH